MTNLELIRRFKLFKWYEVSSTLLRGKSFGEQVLKNNRRRQKTIKVISEYSHFAVLNKDEYNKILKRAKIRNTKKIELFIKNIPFFEHYTYT